MKRNLNGRRYDTERAELIAEANRGHAGGNFSAWTGTLCRTVQWSWFLHKSGGPSPHNVVEAGRGISGSWAITPPTEDEALAWLKRHRQSAAIGGKMVIGSKTPDRPSLPNHRPISTTMTMAGQPSVYRLTGGKPMRGP